MASGIEREIKLRFADARSARAAIVAAGAAPLRERRLQRDALLDTHDGFLRERQSALRVRVEDGLVTLTFKGPVQPSPMKLREEVETGVVDATLLLIILERMGYTVWFRYEKFREEFALAGCVAAIDETPAGTFVEIEGDESAIGAAARALGRSPSDYIVDSYREIQVRRCEEAGLPLTDMVFSPAGRQ